MNVGSLFTGIGGFDLGLERAGHTIAWQCEADPYRRRVLARHWPGVPCCEDIRNLRLPDDGRLRQPDLHRGRGSDAGGEPDERQDSDVGPVEFLCGGFPCQDLSVAGRRAGLAGERSGLFFEFARVADAVLPDGGWLLIENVPGLLSSNGGRDFAVLLSTLGELGFHDLAWRVLDSRYFGVPQRRRRVFILARRSRGRSASEVLLEPESGGGDFTAGREAGTRVAERVGEGVANALDRRQGGADDNDAQAGHLVTGTLQSGRKHGGRSDDLDDPPLTVAHTLRSEGFDASEDGTGCGTPLIPDGVRTPPGLPGRMDVGAFNLRGREEGARVEPDDLASVRASAGGSSRSYLYGQAEGTDHSALDPKPDGPRYAACGDAVTVNVSYWIGERLMNHAD